MAIPPLRYLDIVQIEHEGEPAFCLHDVEGYVETQAVLSPTALFIASQLDGSRDISDIQALFAEASGGQTMPPEHIQEVVQFLDSNGYLMSDTYLDIRAAAIESYAATPTRTAHLAGTSYPADPDDLRAYIDRFYLHEKGPGQRPGESNGHHLPGLIVPHIDFDRGGPTYAHGYARLAAASKPDTVLVFGVAHHSPPVPFILTRKAFETPLGTLPCDEEMVDFLAADCTWDPFEHEIVHRNEHSIEFHAVMLAHLFGEDVRIVPVLCAHFGDDPDEREATDAFIDRCAEYIAKHPGKVTVIAGADLAHVGERFGDEFGITGAVVQAVEDRDMEDLAHAYSIDSLGWRESVMKDGNERRVCGLNCIDATLRVVKDRATQGTMLHYDYAHDPAGGIVSFASVSLENGLKN